ncbi:MAG: flagellar biosynthesis protein FliQ [Deltaproteobacteria bacterium]|nr:flagellar biosynthesis protein FliQ [Deltaproteobacteria bacterium]
MSPEAVVAVARQAIEVTLLVSLPLLGLGLVVGLAISILQAATQIQEMTLTFVPKILSIFVGLVFLLPWIMNCLTGFFFEVVQKIPHYVR